MLGIFASCGVLVVFGFLQFTLPQEPSGKPEAPAPKAVQTPTRPPVNSPLESDWRRSRHESDVLFDLPSLAASISAHVYATGCQKKTCTILVTDFMFPDGNTSIYGKQLAENLSRELTNKEYKLRVIDRDSLATFLGKERVPAQPNHRAVVNWIADALDVRFIVFGTTEKVGNSLVSLSSQLVDTASQDWHVYDARVNLGPLNAAENLEPMEPFPPLPAITTSSNGEHVERLGAIGTTTPSCTYMPNPPYSPGAMKLKINGEVTAEAVINSQGNLENIRIVRGLPGGLNESTITTMRSWRCHPVLKDGKPVPVLVPFKVTYRLYPPN